jgi:crotonobetaine/carnitine-CoA ligase
MKTPLEVLRLYPEHDYTLAGALASRAARDPRRPFILFENRSWSWQSFGEAMVKIAAGLLCRGVGKGDRVAVMARNSDGHLLVLFALARIGAIMVPVNPEFGEGEARYVLHHAEVCGVVASHEALPIARQACADMAGKPWFLALDSGDGDVAQLRGLLDEPAPSALPEAITADDPCLIIYTSGTTGFPKGALHSQRNFITGGEIYVQRMSLQESERVLILLPMFHMNALFHTSAGTLAAGASMAILPRFSASTFWQAAVQTGANVTNMIEAVGTILKLRPRSEFRPEHKIRAVYGVRQNFAGAFHDEFAIPDLVCGFGMTEVLAVTAGPIDATRKPGFMGKIGQHPDPARPRPQCRVVDDHGQDVADDEVGELWIKTPTIMLGYFHDPEQTSAAFHDGWFMTGDFVRRDSDGNFYYVSRKKDIIRRRGENISGAELDRVIGEHPDVAEVATIAVPAELGEDDILSAIVPREGATLGADDITQWCRARLTAMKVPRYVLFVDQLPHTPTHKIAKAQLRDDPTIKMRAIDTMQDRGQGTQGR